MSTDLLILLLMFLFGTLQGMTFCNLTCGPLLVLRLAGQARGAVEGLRMSLLFSLPRMVVLTVMGGLIGMLGYSVSSISDLSSFPTMRALVYLLISLIMIATGLRFTGLIGKKGRSCSDTPSLKERLIIMLAKMAPGRRRSESRAMMGMGMLISVVCFVEASAASLGVATLVGVDSSDVGSGFLAGSLTMLAYSIGLSIPLLVLGTGASEAGRRFNREDIRIVGGFLLIAIGTILALAQLIMLMI